MLSCKTRAKKDQERKKNLSQVYVTRTYAPGSFYRADVFFTFFSFWVWQTFSEKKNFTASRKNEDINMWALFPEDFNANNFIQRKNKNEFVYTKIVYFFYISVWWVVTTMLWAFISELRGFISKNVAVPLQPLKILTDFGFMTLPRWLLSRKT